MEMPLILNDLNVNDFFYINDEIYQVMSFEIYGVVVEDISGKCFVFSRLEIVKILPF